jgi:hypothetical protein
MRVPLPPQWCGGTTVAVTVVTSSVVLTLPK